MSAAAILITAYVAIVVGSLIWLGRSRGRYDSAFEDALAAARKLDRMP